MIALPVLQFCLFYIYVNFNSIIMAFKTYKVNIDGLGYTTSFAGWDNFAFAFDFLKNSGKMLGNTMILFACNIVIVLGFSMIFSYYIAKRYFLADFFRVVLYIPHIVSSVVFVILYKYITTDVYMALSEKLFGVATQGLLDGTEKAQFVTVLIYNVWIGFGVQVMLFSNAMSAIDTSIVEAAQLDGVGVVQEFIHITVPSVFPTFVTFFLVNMAGLFTNQMELFTFFANTGKNQFDTIGFYLYRKASTSELYGTEVTFPQLAALGVVLTLILAPITILVRKLLNKYGPGVD